MELHYSPTQFDIESVSDDRKLNDIWMFSFVRRRFTTATHMSPSTSAIYRLIDYRIGIGEWKLEDRQQHFAELLAILERTEQKVFGPEVLH